MAESPIQYALIQYMRDPRRREPRNIGVVCWKPGLIGFLFVDASRAKKLGADKKTFERWRDYWLRFVDAGCLNDRYELIPWTDPASWDYIKNTGRGNYRIVQSGESLEVFRDTDRSVLPDFLKRIFLDLVA